MIRKIISIDQEKCNGCALCITACHEGAIGLVDGKAKLLRDDYCDGLGDCLPACPVDAISFIEREADAYDEAAVLQNKQAKQTAPDSQNNRPRILACPGIRMKTMDQPAQSETPTNSSLQSSWTQLRQFPIQLQLVPVNAPYFANSHILIAADCAAYAYGNFHNDFMKGKITLVGCPKLDPVDYSDKLARIFQANTIKSVTLTRMEVPCCGGLSHAVQKAIAMSGKDIPLNITVIGTDGRILN